jgi:hypothetical protein
MKRNHLTARLAILLEAQPTGMTSGDAAALLGTTRKEICKSVRKLVAEGRAATARSRFEVRVCLIEREADMLRHCRLKAEQHAQEQKAVKLAHDRQRYWKFKESGEPMPDGFVHRIVPAEMARSIRKLGVSSVWELAA